MNILEFIEKYNYKKYENCLKDDFKIHFNELLENNKKTESLTLMFHTFLENYFPFEILKEIIEYDENGKEEILTNENTFKWSCAFGNHYLLLYLNDKVEDKHKFIESSVNAAILQYRVDNIKALYLLGYEKEVFSEKSILQSISRSQQSGAGLNIVEFMFKNRDKWKMTNYIENELEKSCFSSLSSLINNENIFNYFLDKYKNINKKEIKDDIPNLLGNLIKKNKLEKIDVLLNSIYQIDVEEYFKKPKLIIDNLRLDNKNEESLLYEDEKKLNKIIETYPNLIKEEDIKLWMMNGESLNLKKWIESKRKLKKSEIKKAFITLSSDFNCFQYLISVIDINKIKFNLAEGVKLLNNYYDQIKYYDDIDYNLDSNYVELGKKLLMKDNYNEYREELKNYLYDDKLLSVINKEFFMHQLEEKLTDKKTEKKLKI